ncbi:MAG: chorismate synthase [Bacteroidales bacterium]|jgi:chorismate synthase|nr:chorismate synthase [Bacteroidales bacterium]MCI1784729.1 chorismate synthase [Bacteroidales bacterium]
MNSFGRIFRVSVFGESHGREIGALLDGVIPGIDLCENDFTADVSRRKSGAEGTTPRIEDDIPVILSGVYKGKTTGAPLAIVFENKNTRSSDYDILKEIPRPGHADYTGMLKYDGFNDPRGGGHFSGRLTLPLVAAGVVAKKMLGFIASECPSAVPPSVSASLVEVGGKKDKSEWHSLLETVAKEGDSVGGVVECKVTGFPAGFGEPFFDSVESEISHIIFAIPGVRGIEFGDGFAASGMRGSEHNDPLGPKAADGIAYPVKNGSGGINGGISNGNPIIFRVAFKPTSSISRLQKTCDIVKNSISDLKIHGRHDVCFALRTPVIVEAVTAIVLSDLILKGKKL